MTFHLIDADLAQPGIDPIGRFMLGRRAREPARELGQHAHPVVRADLALETLVATLVVGVIHVVHGTPPPMSTSGVVADEADCRNRHEVTEFRQQGKPLADGRGDAPDRTGRDYNGR